MAGIVTREDFERREDAFLAAYAMRSGASRGRRWQERPDPFRSPFQRDRDRILHCAAFRRLESKTQVFVSRTGDHYRTRLTHSLEVAQIARSIARILMLNEDLAEGVALAHDLGHTPFGHSGGDVLAGLMKDHGGFEHNAQSLRILERLERRYPDFPGLNLSYELRESVIKHKRPFVGAAYADFRPDEGPLLEAQLVDVCDGIAYNSHDLDDGLLSGILAMAAVEELGIWRIVSDRVRARWSDLDPRLHRLRCVSGIIDFFLHDLIAETRRRLEDAGIVDVADVRASAVDLVGFSEETTRLEHELRGFLYEEFYTHYKVHRMRNRARIFIEGLFGAFVERPKLMPPKFQARIEEEGLHRTVADYIAGMTDSYAQEEYRRLFNPYDETL